MPIISGGVGNTTAQDVASGKLLPVADATGVTVDTTTYNDTIKGSGKLTTLVFPASQGALAIALAGDAFPRWVMDADASDFGITFGDGTFDCAQTGGTVGWRGFAAQQPIIGSGNGSGVFVPAAATKDDAPKISQLSPKFTIASGALPTVQLSSGTGAQVSTSRDVETYTPLTLTAVGGTVVVAVSPDNVTYSTIMTVTPAVNASVTDVTVRVPAAWYLKMTATNATLGVTTYY